MAVYTTRRCRRILAAVLVALCTAGLVFQLRGFISDGFTATPKKGLMVMSHQARQAVPGAFSSPSKGGDIDGHSHGAPPIPDATIARQQHVLVFASMRTGSSFVGNLLGSSTDTFYLFEPGHGLQITLNAVAAKLGIRFDLMELYPSMLHQFFWCDFRKHDYYLKYLSKQPVKNFRNRAPRLYDACRRQASEPYCLVEQSVVTNRCTESAIVAFKTIRIPGFNLLRPMIEDKALNLKVIHLVRDPRAMIVSIVLAMGETVTSLQHLALPDKTDTFASKVLGNYCRDSLTNWEIGTRSPSLRRRYTLLRYEDVASDTVHAAGRIYAFLGRDQVPKSVLQWIDANTKSNEPGQYTTARNSSEVYQNWRRNLPFNAAKAIEEVGQCREMMTRMGYRLLEDEKHLKDMSRSLVDKVPSVGL